MNKKKFEELVWQENLQITSSNNEVYRVELNNFFAKTVYLEYDLKDNTFSTRIRNKELIPRVIIGAIFYFIGSLLVLGLHWFNESKLRKFAVNAKNQLEKEIEVKENSKMTNLDNLEKLANLKEKGIISEEEFLREKSKILGG